MKMILIDVSNLLRRHFALNAIIKIRSKGGICEGEGKGYALA